MSPHLIAAVRASLDAIALMLIAAVCALGAMYSAPSEPRRSYDRPATVQEIQERQGDQLMQDLRQEGQQR